MSFWNSILVTVLTTVGQVLSCSLVAYGFARFNFKRKNILFMILLNNDDSMGYFRVPRYMEFNIRMDQYTGALIVPAWSDLHYYVFHSETSSLESRRIFEETARIDGANQFQIYWKIFMPIMKPSLILVGVLNMLTVWNDYLGPLIFLQDRNKYTWHLDLLHLKEFWKFTRLFKCFVLRLL
ncbi:MAG: ABC transporter permease subunit [Coprococcus sp.]